MASMIKFFTKVGTAAAADPVQESVDASAQAPVPVVVDSVGAQLADRDPVVPCDEAVRKVVVPSPFAAVPADADEIAALRRQLGDSEAASMGRAKVANDRIAVMSRERDQLRARIATLEESVEAKDALLVAKDKIIDELGEKLRAFELASASATPAPAPVAVAQPAPPVLLFSQQPLPPSVPVAMPAPPPTLAVEPTLPSSVPVSMPPPPPSSALMPSPDAGIATPADTATASVPEVRVGSAEPPAAAVQAQVPSSPLARITIPAPIVAVAAPSTPAAPQAPHTPARTPAPLIPIRKGVLMTAARSNKVHEVEAALAAGASVEETDQFGYRVLTVAAQHGCLEAVQMLVSHGANVAAKDATGKSALDWAIQKKQRAVEEFLGRYK